MAKASSKKKSSKIVTMDRRKPVDRREKSPSKAPQEERRAPAEVKVTIERRKKKPRRRQIDPTTCERDYSLGEIEFMQAMDGYKHRTGNRFPTCGEVLAIIEQLGYILDVPSRDPEEDFADALEDYKQSSGRMFPTCSEVLEVILGLGYRQPQAAHALSDGAAWSGSNDGMGDSDDQD